MYRANDSETGETVAAHRADPSRSYVCPGCGEPVARRRSSIGTWFFAHRRRTPSDCPFRAATNRTREAPVTGR